MVEWMDLFPEEMKEPLKEMGQPAFRAEQIFSWLSRGRDFPRMTNLPIALRESLAVWLYPAKIERVEPSRDGQTEKYLFALRDGHIVEGVLLRYHHGNTLCLSTQVGCRMGCAFCASTIDGCARSLAAGEMLAMAALVNAKYAEKDARGIANLVLMGSGEPMDNYDAVVRFIRLAAHEKGLGISPRNISLSTCGIVEGIGKLCGEKLPVTLSLSLHAPNDEIRRQIMPVAKAYTIEETLRACRAYVAGSGRRLIVEYTLIGGLNDAPEHARELAGRLRGLQCLVNLIELNPVEERPWLSPPSARAIGDFAKALEEARIPCTLRRSLGEDIQGACGQLRRKYIHPDLEGNP